MTTPRGVTLIEVLVATVLLAVGIHATLGALFVSQRWHRAARERDALASHALDRLDWWSRHACTAGDTLVDDQLPGGLALRWSVQDSLGRRQLRWQGRGPGNAPQRLDFSSSWRCD